MKSKYFYYFLINFSFKSQTNTLCLKCNKGYSLIGDLTCLKTINGCRIYDSQRKHCLQCIFGWYMNDKLGCNKGNDLIEKSNKK